MAGTCNSVRCRPTSALSRAEVTGDFRGSLMRRSSKVRSTRRRDCGDYQAAAWTTCSAAELNRRPRYKRAMLALWLMTALGRYCCKSRKSNDLENLAKVDFCTSLLLRRCSTPLLRSVIDFG